MTGSVSGASRSVRNWTRRKYKKTEVPIHGTNTLKTRGMKPESETEVLISFLECLPPVLLRYFLNLHCMPMQNALKGHVWASAWAELRRDRQLTMRSPELKNVRLSLFVRTTLYMDASSPKRISSPDQAKNARNRWLIVTKPAREGWNASLFSIFISYVLFVRFMPLSKSSRCAAQT